MGYPAAVRGDRIKVDNHRLRRGRRSIVPDREPKKPLELEPKTKPQEQYIPKPAKGKDGKPATDDDWLMRQIGKLKGAVHKMHHDKIKHYETKLANKGYERCSSHPGWEF